MLKLGRYWPWKTVSSHLKRPPNKRRPSIKRPRPPFGNPMRVLFVVTSIKRAIKCLIHLFSFFSRMRWRKIQSEIQKLMTDCGPVILLPSRVLVQDKVMFLRKITTNLWRSSIERLTFIKRLLAGSRGWPLDGGSALLTRQAIESKSVRT